MQKVQTQMRHIICDALSGSELFADRNFYRKTSGTEELILYKIKKGISPHIEQDNGL